MLGSRALPRLKAKAVETQQLLPLAAKLVKEHPQHLGTTGVFLSGAIARLNRTCKTLHEQPRKMSASALESVQTDYK
eukprot:9393093-Alexandrium_andersonii.AAC.1